MAKAINISSDGRPHRVLIPITGKDPVHPLEPVRGCLGKMRSGDSGDLWWHGARKTFWLLKKGPGYFEIKECL